MEVNATPLPLDPDLQKLLDIGCVTDATVLQHTQRLRGEVQRLLNIEANLDDHLHQARLADVEMRNAMLALLEGLQTLDPMIAALAEDTKEFPGSRMGVHFQYATRLREQLAKAERHSAQAKVHLLS